MSTFNIVATILFVITTATGIILKVVLMKKRKDLEGFHGYEQKEPPQKSPTDDWKFL